MIERRQNRCIWLSIEKEIKRELQQLLLRHIIVGKLSETLVSDCHRMNSGYAVCNSDLKNIIISFIETDNSKTHSKGFGNNRTISRSLVIRIMYE